MKAFSYDHYFPINYKPLSWKSHFLTWVLTSTRLPERSQIYGLQFKKITWFIFIIMLLKWNRQRATLFALRPGPMDGVCADINRLFEVACDISQNRCSRQFLIKRIERLSLEERFMFTKKLLGLINPIQSFLIRLWEIFLSNIGVTSFQNDIKIPPSVKVSRSYCIKHFFTLFQWISETFINTLYSLFWIHLKFQKASFFRFFFFRCTRWYAKNVTVDESSHGYS